MIVVVCGLSALLLTACERDRLVQPLPRVEPVQIGTTSTLPAGSGTSVPTAASVFPPAAQSPSPAAASVRTNKTMTRSEEATAMPMPGQNNDHSAPVRCSPARQRPMKYCAAAPGSQINLGFGGW